MANKSRTNNSTDVPDEAERLEEETAPAPATDASPELADEIVELRKERDGLHDRMLRQAAEFDNYRKRVDRERKEASEYAAADVLRDVLPIIDDFERALEVFAARGFSWDGVQLTPPYVLQEIPEGPPLTA